MKKTIFKFRMIFYVFVCCLYLCSPLKKRKIFISCPLWAESVAFSYLAQVLLEEKNYSVDIVYMEIDSVFISLSQGKSDLFMDAWLPNTHREYWEKHGKYLAKIGESFRDASTGLVVPGFVDVSSINELNEYVDLFDGVIHGIEKSSGIFNTVEKAIEEYKLNYQQKPGSDSLWDVLLIESFHKKKPIIFSGWKPHYIWTEFDLKYLKDTKGIFLQDACVILSRKGFLEEFPELKNFFTRFQLSEIQLSSLEKNLNNYPEKKEAVKKWVEMNRHHIKHWWD